MQTVGRTVGVSGLTDEAPAPIEEPLAEESLEIPSADVTPVSE